MQIILRIILARARLPRADRSGSEARSSILTWISIAVNSAEGFECATRLRRDVARQQRSEQTRHNMQIILCIILTGAWLPQAYCSRSEARSSILTWISTAADSTESFEWATRESC